MKRLKIMILMIFVAFATICHAQLPYAWTSGVNPGWTSSNPTINTLSFQTACYGEVSTSDCISYPNPWNTYNNGQITTYTSPVYDFYCGLNVNVSMQLDIYLENRYDWLYFQYSTDGGTTWINPVASYAGGASLNPVNLTPYQLATAALKRKGWTGSSGISVTYSIATSTTTCFRYIFVSNATVNTDFFGNIYYADILSFSATCPSPLPIELTDFKCETLSNNIMVSWSTATETNNQEFQLWRSTDAVNWIKLVTKPGAGTTSSPNSYWFNDYFPPTGTYYYKLVQKDFDGTETTSDITSCSYVQNAGVAVKYYNMIGQEIMIDQAAPGLYVREYILGGFTRREVYYKTE